MDELLAKYGYFAVFVGTLLEGGTLLSLAGFLAHQGYMKLLPWVLVAGFAGNFIDTLVCYYIGRQGGAAVTKRRPKWKERLEDLHQWVEKYESLTIIGIRFIPGLRTLGGVAIGIARVPQAKFILLNALGAFLWALTIGLSGYFFGRLLKVIMDDAKQYEIPIIVGIVVLGILVWIFFGKTLRRRYQTKAEKSQ